MNNKIIISVAPVCAGTPVDSDMLAEDVAKCAAEGASMCHLHCRDAYGQLTPDTDYMAECFNKILEKTDIVVQVSTGGVSSMNIHERCLPLQYPRTETASLNAGSTNLGDSLYVNTPADISFCAREIYKRDIRPDIEVFDIGMISTMESIFHTQPCHRPVFYNLVFGHRGGMPPSVDALIAFRSMVPPDAKWGITHFGRKDWGLIAAAVAMGSSAVRVGFEDSYYLTNGRYASYNYELVHHLSTLIKQMGFSPASADEARMLFGCTPK